MTRQHTLERSAPDYVSPKLNTILLEETSLALMTAPRLEPKNRTKNATLCTALKRILRLTIIKDHHTFHWKCEAKVDPWGDHCLRCKKNHKTVLSNGCRDGIHDILKQILPVTKMIHSGTQMEKGVTNIFPSLPTLKPFDLSVRLNHLFIQGAWQIPFTFSSTPANLFHQILPLPSRLLLSMNQENGREEQNNRQNYHSIPIAVGPLREIGSTF